MPASSITWPTRFKKENCIDLRKDRLALQRLKEAAEKAKIELSSATQTEVNLPFITADQTGPKHLVIKITRAKLEALSERTDPKDHRALQGGPQGCRTQGAGNRRGDPGGRHDPHAQGHRGGEAVSFGREPHRGVNPDEVVAIGAAIQGGVLKGDVRTCCCWT